MTRTTCSENPASVTSPKRSVRSHGVFYNRRLVGRIYRRQSGKYVAVSYSTTTNVEQSKVSTHVSLQRALNRVAEGCGTIPGYCTLIMNYQRTVAGKPNV